MKKLILLILVSGICFCSISFAQNLVIGVEKLDYLPYYSGVDGEYKGFARELLDAFAKTKGYKLQYKELPVRRLFKELLDESVDFKFPDNPYWQTDMKKMKKVIYSDTVVKTIDGVMVLPANKGKGIKEFKKIGTVMGFTPWPFKEMIGKGEIQVSENPNFKGLLTQVIKGRVSGAYLNPVVADYQLKKVLQKPGALVYNPSLPFSKNNYLLSTVKHKKVINEFNTFLVENKALVQSLKDKYEIVEE